MSYQALKHALTEQLEQDGTLSQLRATIQAKLFEATAEENDPRPELTADRLLLNEAIREYLQFSGYRNTAAVFLAESGQPDEPLQRDYLAHKLNLKVPISKTRSQQTIPILYSLLTPSNEKSHQSKQLQMRATEVGRDRAVASQINRKMAKSPARIAGNKPQPLIFSGGSAR